MKILFKKRGILFIIFLFWLTSTSGCFNQPKSAATAEHQINVFESPVQSPTNDEPFVIQRGNSKYRIIPLANYYIQAKVKSISRYRFDKTSKISPVDFALVWGELSEPRADKFISYSQSARWYYYRYTDKSPWDSSFISRHSANNHILPASNNIRKAILSVNKNDRVALSGWLVAVELITADGSQEIWRSSLTRDDTGDYSCEVLWVKEVQLEMKIYR